MIRISTALSISLSLLLLAVPGARAADVAAVQPAAVQPSAAPIGREEMDSLFAPVALYSDNLLAQLLMASTYPLEIVQASRFAEQHPNLKGDALDAALAKQSWDQSVKSLVQVPTVLKMMSDKLDWTQKVGDAYLGQPKDVADSIQRLRQRASNEGNLKTNEHQTVTTHVVREQGSSHVVQEQGSSHVVHEQQQIIIEQTQPDVMYVPAYNPTYVYGSWPYASYPPYAWGAGYYPYYPAGGALAWGVGAAITAGIWNNGWDWNNGNININNNFNNFNGRWGNNNWNGGNGVWHHDRNHRGGVGYRDQASRDRYGRGGDRNGVANRQQFRGRDGVGSNNQRLSNRDLTGGRTNSGAGRVNNRQSGRSNAGFDQGRRNNSQAGGRQNSRQNSGRSNAYGNRSSGYDGIGNANRTRQSSNRGAASRSNYGGNRSAYGGNRSGYNRSSYGSGGRGGYGGRSSYGGGRSGGGRSYGGGGRGGHGGGRGGGGRGGGGRGGGRR